MVLGFGEDCEDGGNDDEVEKEDAGDGDEEGACLDSGSFATDHLAFGFDLFPLDSKLAVLAATEFGRNSGFVEGCIELRCAPRNAPPEVPLGTSEELGVFC